MTDVEILMPLIKQFMPFAQKQMGFDRPPKLFLKGDASNAADPLGKTGFYDPGAESITLYITDRHPKDILRSLSHELMHHTQNCRGEFTDSGEMGEGYAQSNPHMRTMEIEAYKASICFRDWEDSLKETIYFEHLQKGVEKVMSIKDWKNGEIKSLLSEAWGFKMDLANLNEDSADKHRTAANTIEEEVEELDEQGTHAAYAQGEAAYAQCTKKEEEGGMSAKDAHDKCDADHPRFTGAGGGGQTFSSHPFEEGQLKEGNLREDSGEDEAWHEWKNEHADDDHIREIEHHLRSLKDDRDYERHGAEDDDDKFENEGLEEMCGPDTEEPGHGEVIVMGDEEGVVGDEGADPSSRVAALMDELKGLLMQLAGGEEEVAVEEPMEEGGLANRKGDPRNKRPEASPVREDKLRAMVRKAIKEAMK